MDCRTAELEGMVGAMPRTADSDPHGYLERAGRHAAEGARFARRSRQLSYTRLVVFLAATAVLLSIFPGPASHLGLRVAIGLAGFAGFGVLVYRHSRVEERERWFAALSALNREAAGRVARRWSDLPPAAVQEPDADHLFAGDLDVFGHASLFQLLGWLATDPGRQTLARWLTTGAAPEDVRERQRAVAELARLREERETFAALGRLIDAEHDTVDELVCWAEGGPWFTRRAWVRWAIPALTVSLVAAAAAHAAGLTDHAWWLAPLVVSVGMMAVFGKRVEQQFTRVFTRAGALEHHARLFAHVTELRVEAPCLLRVQAKLRGTGMAASREIASLARIEQFAELRRSALLHLPLALAGFWDFHVLIALERWQARTAPHLRRWYAALGEFDALAALASLAHDNPGWPFPDIDRSAVSLDARQLGHPLIPEGRRVANDVSVGPPGSFLMVTGSNMSGKSTLLRAIGINAVLAQAGGPVCAGSMRMPPLALATSMRVQDSLEEGVSYFMAAVRRLALVVDAARRSGSDGPMLLYLLDEVLQGTNTAERQVAVRRILRHLLTLPVVGVVTTHDLELAACDELEAACRAVHFSEGVEHHETGLRLTFDYALKPGIATSRNALKLLKIVGLDD